jgi:hypothetical protein
MAVYVKVFTVSSVHLASAPFIPLSALYRLLNENPPVCLMPVSYKITWAPRRRRRRQVRFWHVFLAPEVEAPLRLS